MEPPDTLGIRVSDVCRSCLTKSDDMTNFATKNDETSEIIAMLASVGNIEIEISPHLPSHLCKTCEAKLRMSYDFQLLIQRSNEMIREYVRETDSVVGDEEVDIKAEEINIKDEDKSVANAVVKARRKSLKFSASDVEEAIKEYKERHCENVECIKCGFVTNNPRSLSVHMSRLHKDVKDRWCSVCNLEVDSLSEHTAGHCDDHLTCKFCGKKFNTRGHFYEHLRTHSNIKPFTCYICQRGFIARRHLDKHLRVHMNKRPYKCHMCPSNFPLRKALRLHLRDHSYSKTRKGTLTPEHPSILQNYCKICKKRVRSLADHLGKIHSPKNLGEKKPEGYLCTQCGKKFSSLSRFRLHTRIHTGEAPYKCQYCDKRMTNRNHLVLHERTHTGERPYVCSVCGRGFSQSSVLNTHMRIHTGRPIACDMCSKRFCRPAELRLHMRQHTGEKPYQCPECEQAFRQQSHLSEHLKRHSDERPYKCAYCDKSFKQMSILKSHVTIHTGLSLGWQRRFLGTFLGEKPFKCSQCPYACRQRYSLTKHMWKHSNDAPNPEKPHFCELCQKGYTTMAMLMSHNDLMHRSLKNFD